MVNTMEYVVQDVDERSLHNTEWGHTWVHRLAEDFGVPKLAAKLKHTTINKNNF